MGDMLPLPDSVVDLESLRVSLAASVGEGYVVEVTLARPQKMNALGASFWLEFPRCLRALDQWPPCRCILLTADGPAFCSGIDLHYISGFFTEGEDEMGLLDVARKALRLRRIVEQLQSVVSCVEEVNKPIVAAVSGPCLGAGVDLTSSCDIRLCASDALFSVKEVDLGMAPDIGTLQRLPRIVRSGSWAREVCYTGRFFGAIEAEREGFVSSVYPDKAALRDAALSLCLSLAEKSPVALAATKQALNHSRGRPVAEGLREQVAWSAAMLQTVDIPLSVKNQLNRKKESKRATLPAFAGL